jgi:hypothetical protein
MRRRPPPLYRALAATTGWMVVITMALTAWALWRGLLHAHVSACNDAELRSQFR